MVHCFLVHRPEAEGKPEHLHTRKERSDPNGGWATSAPAHHRSLRRAPPCWPESPSWDPLPARPREPMADEGTKQRKGRASRARARTWGRKRQQQACTPRQPPGAQPASCLPPRIAHASSEPPTRTQPTHCPAFPRLCPRLTSIAHTALTSPPEASPSSEQRAPAGPGQGHGCARLGGPGAEILSYSRGDTIAKPWSHRPCPEATLQRQKCSLGKQRAECCTHGSVPVRAAPALPVAQT